MNPPIYQSAGFSYPTLNNLKRYLRGKISICLFTNFQPTIAELERQAYLDSALGVVGGIQWAVFHSFTWLSIGAQGNNIVVSNSLFGGSRDLFEKQCPVRP